MCDKDNKKKPVIPVLEPLEPRTLFSADVAGSLIGVPPDVDNLQPVPFDVIDLAPGQLADDQPEPFPDRLNEHVATELFFIDSAVRDYQVLADHIRSQSDSSRRLSVYIVDSDVDGFAYVGSILSFYQQQVDAVHIVSHGTDASVSLGNTRLDNYSVASRAVELSAWGNALSHDADIAFYGCNLASSGSGKDLVHSLAELTGADIAASVDLTGHSEFNANWELEYQYGDVEAAPLFSDQAGDVWKSTLAVVNVSTTLDIVDAPDLTSVAALVSSPGPDGAISLREAIIATESDVGADEIQLGLHTYTLSIAGANDDGDLNVSDDLIIRGDSAATTKIDGAGIDRVMEVSAGSVELDGLTISGGKSLNGKVAGGVLVSGGSLTLNDVAVSDNAATNKEGGGIYVESGASLFAYDSIFRNNSADPDNAPNYKDGGALYNKGDVTLERVTLQTNKGDRGGAIHNHGTLNMTDVWLLNNTASSAGGAIDNHGGVALNMDRVTFESNVSSAEGGALRTDGPTTIRNVTFTSNTASDTGGALDIDGGSTVVTIENSTFFGNLTSTDGGAISSASSAVTVMNTIFSGNSATTAGTDAIDGSVLSHGFNLIDDASYAGAAASDIVGVSAQLNPLQNNGGYVKTHAPQAGSPVINSGGGSIGEDATGVSHDQFPDIGAFESRIGHTVAKLYWTDFNDNAIYRANEGGTEVQLIQSTSENPFDIEIELDTGRVDSVNPSDIKIYVGRIYWAEADGNYLTGGNLGSIYSANLDGTDKTQILSNVNFPSGIALDTANNHLYVTLDATTTNTTASPYVNEIVRYNLDGSNPVLIASGEYVESPPDRIRAPTDIEYDPASQRLYWSDRGIFVNSSDSDDEIKLVDLSTGLTQVQVIGRPSEISHSPVGLTVLPGGSDIYWANTKGISYIDYDASVQSENDSATLSSVFVSGVQYHAQTDTIYLTDYDGSIKTISRDLLSSTTLISGLSSPLAIAVASATAIDLSPTVSINDPLAVLEGESAGIADSHLSTTDADTADTDLVYTVTIAPVHGRLVDGLNNTRTTFTQQEIADGEISYEHFGGENTADAFTFEVTDGVIAILSTVFSINVTPQNDVPVALPEAYSLLEGGTIKENLILNDTDPENRLDADGITIVLNPVNGSVAVNGDGTIDYTHDGSETTTDSFDYTISDLDGATSNTVTVSLTIGPQNDRPVANPESYTVDEGSTTAFNLVANDADAEGGLDVNSLQIVGGSGPAHGLVTINGDGTVDYTHDGSETLADSFRYSVQDLDGATSDPVSVDIAVNPVNDAPVASMDNFIVSEGSSTTLNLVSNDVDAENRLDLGSIVVAAGPSNGTYVLNGDGTLYYSHDSTETTSDGFSYTIRDLDGAFSNSTTVSLSVTPVNDTPVANADNFTIDEDSTTTLDLAANDVDAESRLDLNSIVITAGPSNGTIVLNGDGTLDYSHGNTETTADSFSYTIADLDGATSISATVSLSITPRNDVPVANTDSFTVDEGATTTLNVASNDVDAESRLDLNSLVITGGPSNGTIVLNGDGSLDYSHDGTETVADSFSYSIRDLDGAVSNSTTVNLTITPHNDSPDASADNFTVIEGSATTLDLAANDSDAENRLDPAGITPGSLPANGSLVVNADGTVDYTHDGSETVSDGFSYSIGDLDGATSGVVTVTLTVTPLNDPPVAIAETFIVDEGVSATVDLAANDTDAENRLDTNGIVIVAAPSHGAIAINGDGTINYLHNGSETTADSFDYHIGDLDGALSNTVTVGIAITPQNDAPSANHDNFAVAEGAAATLDLAANDSDAENRLDVSGIVISAGPSNGSISVRSDGTVNYTHDGSETLSDSFSYTIKDLDGATSNLAVVGLSISPQNDAPVAVADNFTVSEGASETLNLVVNDTDAESQLDTSSIVVTNDPPNGSVIVNSDGTVYYTHDGSETIADSFSYEISDVSGAVSNVVTVGITVAPQNDPPLAVAESFTVVEGGTQRLNVAANDSDAESRLDLSGIVITGAPVNGTLAINSDGTVDYAHDGSETTTDDFTYRIKDLEGVLSNTVTVSLAIAPQNDAPVALPEAYAIAEGSTTSLMLAVNDSDAENQLDVSSIVITEQPVNGSIAVNGDGTVDYTHDGTETSSDAFRYSISDQAGAVSNEVAVALAVTPVNDSPVAVVETFTVAEGASASLDLASNDIDAEGALDIRSIVISAGPANGSIAVNSNGTVTYTHNGSETTGDSFSYAVKDFDGATSNVVEVTLAITPENDKPVAVAESFSVPEGGSANLDLASNDIDVEGALDAASIVITSSPPNGAIGVNSDGTVNYAHDGSETTSDSFSYLISDLQGAVSNIVTVSITITPQNDAPVAVADTVSLEEGAVVTIDVALNDTDAEYSLDPAGIVIVDAADYGATVVNSNGTLMYTHDGSETTYDTLSYTISDRDGAVSNTATVDLNITPVNDAPRLVADSYTVTEGASRVFDILANDSDSDDGLDPDSVWITAQPEHGSVITQADGSIVYLHDGSESTVDQLSYSVSDISGVSSDPVVVQITIVPENDPPVVAVPPAQSYTLEKHSDTIVLDANSFFDPDTESLNYSARQANGADLPAWLLFNGEALTFSVTSDLAFGSEVTVVVTAYDLAGGEVSTTLVIDVLPPTGAALPEVYAEEIEFLGTVGDSATRDSSEPSVVSARAFVEEKQTTIDPTARATGDGDFVSFSSAITGEAVARAPLETVVSEDNSRKAAKRIVELEPVVQHNPLRDMFIFDEEKYSSVFRNLIDVMDEVKKGFQNDEKFKTGLLATSAMATSSLAVGYALWLIRGGALLFSFMASMPVWRFVDPFPVLGQHENDDDDDVESLESIVKKNKTKSPSQGDQGRGFQGRYYQEQRYKGLGDQEQGDQEQGDHDQSTPVRSNQERPAPTAALRPSGYSPD